MPDPAARRRWTVEQLLAESERAARALLGRVQPGERVAVWANNIPEWLLEYGCALANLTLVTVNPASRPPELAYVLGRSGSSGVFLVAEFRGNSMVESLESFVVTCRPCAKLSGSMSGRRFARRAFRHRGCPR